MSWLRGGDKETPSTTALAAGLGELDGMLNPGKRKQTEHVEQEKLRRVNIGDAAPPVDVDLDQGTAVIRRPGTPERS